MPSLAPRFLAKTVGQLGRKSSPLRVALDRVLPNFDRNLMRPDTSGWAMMGGKARDRALGLLAGTSLVSAKGTRTAFNAAMKNALKARDGLKPGSAIGGSVGALGGGIAGWRNGEGDDRARNALLGVLGGGAAGAAGGGAVGMGGTALYKGVRSGAANFSRRMKGWDSLISMGIMPTALLDHGEDFASSVVNGLGAKGLRGKRDGLMAAIQKGRRIIDQGDKASVIQLSSAGRDPGRFMLRELPEALSNASIKDLNAGGLVNPKIVEAINNPLFQKKMQRIGLDKIHGKWKGDTVIDIGESDPTGKLKQRFDKVFKDTVAAGGGFTEANFTPRQRTGSLWHDIKNRGKQVPSFTGAKLPDSNAADKFLQELSPLQRRRLGLEPGELRDYLKSRLVPGNAHADRVWAGGAKDMLERQEQPFTIFPNDPSRSITPKLKVRKLDTKARTMRQRLMEADPRLDPAGVAENWRWGPNDRKELAAIRDRLIRGEKLDVKREIGNLAGVTDDELPILFGKSVPKPPAAPAPREIKLDEIIPPTKTAPKPRLAPVVSSGDDTFKKGDIWDLLTESIKQERNNGGNVKKFLPPWGRLQEVLGMTPKDLADDAGVTTPEQWEQFKRMIMREVGRGEPVLRKAAACVSPTMLKLRWAMLKRKGV